MFRYALAAAFTLFVMVPVGAIGARVASMLSPDYANLATPSDVAVPALIIHGLLSLGFFALGMLQVFPGRRERNPARHRKLGKIAIPLGFAGALSGLFVTFAYPQVSSVLVTAGRVGAGLFWLLALVMAVRAIRARDWAIHGRWMMRAFAIVLPVGTLPFVVLPYLSLFNGSDQGLDIIVTAAWPLHVIAIELLMRRRRITAATP